MSYANNPQRQCLIEQVLDATTLSEINSATTALRQWVAAHPDDLGIIDGFEQLALMRMAAEQVAAEQASLPEPEKTPALAR